MDGLYPIDDGIYVLKGGRRLGPFTVENLLDGLETGDFSEEDVCLRPGASDCERIRDLLDWEMEQEEDLGQEDPGHTSNEFDDEEDWEDLGSEDDESDDEPPPSPIAGAAASGKSGAVRDRLLYAGHPSVLTFPFSLLALVGGATGGIWLYRMDPMLTLSGLGIAVAGLIRVSFVRFTNDYQIRSRRIEIVTGLLARSSREVRIEDIRSINVSCRGLPGLLGIGTVDFITSGDSPEVSFHRVWAARKIKTLVRRLQDAQ